LFGLYVGVPLVCFVRSFSCISAIPHLSSPLHAVIRSRGIRCLHDVLPNRPSLG
jgi:hypothetical protein